MLVFAVLRLGLTPHAFWALSVCEWRALLEAAAPQNEIMTRDALMQLINTHGKTNA
ncbi:phage tail assembly chaperone [Marinicaulis aureus]|uniref:Phage tail assembly chaperone n=1 Tax=Hyphococcus aureus TaxID=2666033 RepID=A0ABW1KZF3_9PROT